jgi:hypothetical protein
MQETRETIEVYLENSASKEEIHAIEEAFTAAGLRATVNADLGGKSIGPGELWAMYIVFPFPLFFEELARAAGKQIGTQLGNEIGKDVCAAYRRVIDSIWSARGANGGIVQRDNQNGVEAELEADLPLEAYDKLRKLDLTRFTPGHLKYDRETGDWKNLLN